MPINAHSIFVHWQNCSMHLDSDTILIEGALNTLVPALMSRDAILNSHRLTSNGPGLDRQHYQERAAEKGEHASQIL
jgi:hypothetical protein